MIPKIILAMGASHVEAVANIENALNAPSIYDYIVVQDRGLFIKDNAWAKKVATIVPFQWVKDCLTIGRILDIKR